MSQWSGRRAWIIGASSGIGAALAQRLADGGAEVTVSARNTQALTEVAGGRMRALPLDVTDAAAVQSAADSLRESGDLDLVVISSGYWRQDVGQEFNLDEFRRHIEVNLLGSANCIAAVLPQMLAADRGHIAVVASVAGYRGLPGSLGYGSSKAALLHLMEALRATVSRSNVKVQTISPGFVETPMTAANRFRMPFLIKSDQAAVEIERGLLSGKSEVVFPFGMAVTMKLAKLLPSALWHKIASRSA